MIMFFSIFWKWSKERLVLKWKLDICNRDYGNDVCVSQTYFNRKSQQRHQRLNVTKPLKSHYQNTSQHLHFSCISPERKAQQQFIFLIYIFYYCTVLFSIQDINIISLYFVYTVNQFSKPVHWKKWRSTLSPVHIKNKIKLNKIK